MESGEINDSDEEGMALHETPSISIHRILSSNNCNHEVAIPQDKSYVPLESSDDFQSAKTFEFSLDSFQLEAIKCIDNNQSVLVSAHTSAGKTAVAL